MIGLGPLKNTIKNQLRLWGSMRLGIFLLSTITIVSYLDQTGHPASRSERPLNPKLVYVLYQGSALTDMGVASLGQPIELGDLTLRFDQFNQYTGLIVRKDPGYLVVLLGFILLMTGLGLHFYIKPRYVWALITPKEEGVTIHLAGEGQNNSDHGLKDDLEVYTAALVGVDQKARVNQELIWN